MSKTDGDNPDPLDFNLPDDDLTASGDELEPVGEFALPEESGSDEELGDLDELPALDDEVGESDSKSGKKKKKKKKKRKKEKRPKARKPKKRMPVLKPAEETGPIGSLVLAVCGVSCLVMLVTDVLILVSQGASSILFIILLTTLWLMGTAIPYLLWKGRRDNTVYVVFLGISLAGILLANLLLLLELATYGGDIGAKGAQQSMHVAPAAQSAPDNASATA